MNYSALLETAVVASIEAGKEILDVYSQPIAVETKDDKSPLTMADKRAHLKIMEYLSATSLPVLSEEGKHMAYEERSSWTMFWLVDPLDGTKEFIKRNGEFTVNIALIENQKPVAGVIYVPVTGELYFASISDGAFKCENVVATNVVKGNQGFLEMLKTHSTKLKNTTKPDKYTVVASRSHMSPETEELIAKLRTQYGELDMVSKGSSLKLCLVAEGKANIYPRLAPTMEWDTAAGQAVCEIAGCSVINHHTQTPVLYNKENLLNPWFVVSQ
jgi:3'(2'), 5'-bisphosphate nucleotidase